MSIEETIRSEYERWMKAPGEDDEDLEYLDDEDDDADDLDAGPVAI